MMGRPPKPTAVRAAEGNPGKRKLNTPELRQNVEAPEMPRELTPRAKKEWAKFVRLFEDRGIIRPEDGPNLANLCEAISTLAEARKAMKKLPKDARLLLRAGNGFQANPLLYIIRDQVQVINRIGAEFGFSPAARTRLVYDDEVDAGDELEQLLRGPATSHPKDKAVVQ